MKKISKFISLLLVSLHILYVSYVSADLPVHVEIKDLLGKWKLYKTKTSPELLTCGSTQPNSNQYNVKIEDYKKYLIDNHYPFDSELNVVLSNDFVKYGDVHDITGNEHRKNWNVLAVYDEKRRKKIGTWTTIFDQGFEIRIDNETYTAFMHYEPTGKCPEPSDEDITDSNGETICYSTSYDKTRFGWIDIMNKNNEQLHGCFYAEKYDTINDSNNYKIILNRSISGKKEPVITENKTCTSNQITDFDSYEPKTYIKANKVKLNKNSEMYWHKMKHDGKKKPLPEYMLKVQNQKYACPCNPNENIDNERSDVDPDSPVSPNMIELGNSNVDTNELDLNAYEEIKKSKHTELELNEMPKNFTWGDPFNNNVREYEVIDQLTCGSCYIASQMYVIKRRIEIGLTKLLETKYANDFDDALSLQTVLSCSFYDQGCHGGYPFLVSKMAKLHGIPLNSEFPYTAKQSTCPYPVNKGIPLSMIEAGSINKTESVPKDIKPSFRETIASALAGNDTKDNNNNVIDSGDPNRWYIKEYNYVGGCYGCNQCDGEKIIMNEIYRNGPVVGSIEVTPNFYNYVDGVYYDKGFPHAKKCTVDVHKDNGYVYNITGWEKVNHAIVILGWGEETIDGKLYKYWICRNSWGNGWGKEGYFKMIRGVNHVAIENHAIYIDPDFTRGAGKVLLEKMKNH
ncbi:dipeptidyl aminopeptidase 1, putative [Plasmodium yoelii]|uniref:dipeptidyl-peptidase I n=4 Tax=Plasmodium yoelii TaxID=5861 RepID=A0AAF0B054_PLAYO|nr:dipeptidyl aminopeptidase 1, putative [Plasmodium yoelii]EAA17381.1 cathepsin c precursor [Plasmodium yoelii yoelii]WBY57462.1 dipeptidyl aminopeptidase 1 [Plasmodium yoelii yoelii]CDU18105.1 dipeptidyl aminopeptidase 1, putative [Plasmodium yoelii]VTZ78522.1 dipeptidyl aminopeptidase 1, putative [Plasmodium yoelii]|eukprot:XP_725816.1 dipeptidyl aminopeptidase 1, putative [Plasmodium yoelii]